MTKKLLTSVAYFLLVFFDVLAQELEVITVVLGEMLEQVQRDVHFGLVPAQEVVRNTLMRLCGKSLFILSPRDESLQR